MNYFTTRVELHNAVYTDYETLHAHMANLKFQRTIQETTTKATYHLPTAEYRSHGDITTEKVLELAKLAASKTGKACSVIVTQSANIVFYNLTPIKA